MGKLQTFNRPWLKEESNVFIAAGVDRQEFSKHEMIKGAFPGTLLKSGLPENLEVYSNSVETKLAEAESLVGADPTSLRNCIESGPIEICSQMTDEV